MAKPGCCEKHTKVSVATEKWWIRVCSILWFIKETEILLKVQSLIKINCKDHLKKKAYNRGLR